MEQIRQIGNTPLSISIYSVKSSPTYIHDRGVLEIIFCLKGSVRFSYAYEEFTLHEGEYISVDKDAWYLYEGKDNLCISFFIDLFRYETKYPFICNNLFVCEGCRDATKKYCAEAHSRLKGMLIAMLKLIAEGEQGDNIQQIVDNIVDLFVMHFDIAFYYKGTSGVSEEVLDRLHEINDYLYHHLKENITLGDLADELHLTEGYISEYMRKNMIGFRSMLGYLRANTSESHLLKTDETIITISEECGFSDPKYYYQAFKRWYKCTPKQFRERYGNRRGKSIQYLQMEDIRELVDSLLIRHYIEFFGE